MVKSVTVTLRTSMTFIHEDIRIKAWKMYERAVRVRLAYSSGHCLMSLWNREINDTLLRPARASSEGQATRPLGRQKRIVDSWGDDAGR